MISRTLSRRLERLEEQKPSMDVVKTPFEAESVF
jgi:hypothetical protein